MRGDSGCGGDCGVLVTCRRRLERADFGSEGLVRVHAMRKHYGGVAGTKRHLALRPATEARGAGGDDKTAQAVQGTEEAVVHANRTEAGGGAGVQIRAKILASQDFFEVFSIQ